MKVTLKYRDPLTGQYEVQDLDTVQTGSNYRAYGINTDPYWTSDLSKLAAHMADAIANQLAVRSGWQEAA